MSFVDDAPRREIGHQGGPMGPDPTGILYDTENEVMALAWPTSIVTYEKMRRDAQISAMYNGLTVPILNYPWAVDPNGARDEVVEEFAKDVGLLIVGEDPDTPIGRRKNRFSFRDHIRQALLSSLYGHMFFEQWGIIDPETLMWRLRKLAPRMPNTIYEVATASDGGLKYIRQHTGKRTTRNQFGLFTPPKIPVDQLVAYVWNKEGGNWFGRPLLHPLYRNWLIKDRELRIDAIKHERTGAGVPIIEAPMGASQLEINRLAAMAERYKVGESSGGAVPAGAKFRLVGVEGATSDVIASVRYHDEAMSLGFFSEVKSLGHTAYGSRALGETYASLLVVAQESIASWFADIFNEHVIEDWVDWNFGEDEPAPRIVWEDPNLADPTLDPELATAQKTLTGTNEVAALSDMGVLFLDPEQQRQVDRARDGARATIQNRDPRTVRSHRR